MDFHAAMETFAEAWVAATTQTAVNADPNQPALSRPVEDLPTMVVKEELVKECKSPVEKSSSTTGVKVVQSQNSPGGAKSLPIHCVIEQVSGVPSFESGACQNTSTELDSYAILPSTTSLTDLVRTALTKLGYSSSESINAKGAIQLKNWKPLTFDRITDNLQASVDDILGDLTNVATLKIRICSLQELPIQWTDETVRCVVVELLKEMSQSTLAVLSPLSQSTISYISNGKYINKLCPEKCKEFGEWYKRYKSDPEASAETDTTGAKDTRLTFHPELELPLMRQWYRMCKSPNEDKLRFYMGELNRGHVRQERPKVTVARLKNWWKNERQREKRIQKEHERTRRTRKTDNNSRSILNLDNGSRVHIGNSSLEFYTDSSSLGVSPPHL